MSETKDPLNNLISEVLEELRLQLGVLKERREELNEGGFDKDLSAAAAQLGRAMTSVAAELRAREKMAIKARTAITPQQILEWWKSQPEQVQIHILRELNESHEGQGSVLA